MQQLIDPKTLARIKDLPLVAKTVAEGFLHGLQPSTQRGVGIEFSQYRGYEVGDELSQIDWKLFARSDRYFVREAERESEIDIWFLLDVSRSMLQSSPLDDAQDKKTADWNKLEYGKHLIASLGYLAQKQGDSFGYLSLTDSQPPGSPQTFLPAGNGERHWQKLLLSLAHTKPGNFFPNIELLQHQIERLQKPAIIFVISDLNQKHNEITDFLGKLKTSLSEVVAIQLTCNDELDFNYQGAIRFKDLESKQEILVSASNTKQVYLKNYQDYQNQLDNQLIEKRIHANRFNIDLPLDRILFEYLRQRNRVVR
jgi:uncharacterized protein (DUF58 family)